ncbi:7016_t:CDS:2 [Paraglomus occultum]|uniref:7016_t:CDS:1 n=1 Tax=Paraglomus occultum TaxID=144539 RepID=A0A9N9F6W5_9GLOM|nr:7016_t:CDS:2 [Paraglomus occultum]
MVDESNRTNPSEDRKTARDYIDSYIDSLNSSLGDFLKKSQPKYDPSLNSDLPSTPPPSNASESAKSNAQAWTDNSPKSDKSFLSDIADAPTINPLLFEDNKIIRDNQLREKIDDKPDSIVPKVNKGVFDQKREIHEAALLNCSDLHSDLQECFIKGSWFDKATLCQGARKKFWKCFDDQKVILQDLGYGAPYNTKEQNERMLWEADRIGQNDSAKQQDA